MQTLKGRKKITKNMNTKIKKLIIPAGVILGLLLQLGTALALPPGWGNDVRLTSDPAFSGFSRHTIDVAGNAYVVWQDHRDAPGSGEIYFMKVDPDGATLVPATRLTTDAALSWFPSVARDGSNNIYVAWMDDRDGNSEIYLTQLNSSGATLIDDFRATTNLADSTYPAIAVDSNGRIHLAWAEGRDGNAEIYYREWQVSAGTFAPTSGEIRLTTDGAISWQPTIAVDSANNVHTVFIDDRDGDSDLRYTRVTAGAISVPDTALMNDIGDSSYPSIARDPFNNLHLTWVDSTSGNPEINYMKVNNSGGVIIPPTAQTSNPSASWWPQISSDASGYAQLSWIDDRDGNFEVYYEKLNTSGSVIVNDLRITADPAESLLPAVLADIYSNLRLTWLDTRDTNEEIYFKRALRPTIVMTGVPKGGNTVTFDLSAPLEPQAGYIFAMSLTAAPGIGLGDGREIPLNPNAIFWASLDPVFMAIIGFSGNTQGSLNALGGARITWVLPAWIPPGVPLAVDFFTIDGALSLPYSIRAISPAVSFITQ